MPFRGLYVSDETAASLLSRPLGTNWGNLSKLDPSEAQWFENALEHARQQSQSVLQNAHDTGQKLRLETLADIFALDEFDLDAFLICASSSLDLRYERIFGYLQDDVTRKRPSVNLVLDLIFPSGAQRLRELSRFQAGAPLFAHHLLERLPEPASAKTLLLNQGLAVDDSVVSWLVGSYQPNADIRAYIEILYPQTQPHLHRSDPGWPGCQSAGERRARRGRRSPTDRPGLLWSGFNQPGDHCQDDLNSPG